MMKKIVRQVIANSLSYYSCDDQKEHLKEHYLFTGHVILSMSDSTIAIIKKEDILMDIPSVLED